MACPGNWSSHTRCTGCCSRAVFPGTKGGEPERHPPRYHIWYSTSSTMLRFFQHLSNYFPKNQHHIWRAQPTTGWRKLSSTPDPRYAHFSIFTQTILDNPLSSQTPSNIATYRTIFGRLKEVIGDHTLRIVLVSEKVLNVESFFFLEWTNLSVISGIDSCSQKGLTECGGPSMCLPFGTSLKWMTKSLGLKRFVKGEKGSEQ